MEQINMDLTKFHGESYIENLDKARLSGQVLRLYKVLKDGKAYPCDVLSELSNVSEGSIPKRTSDLRVYHRLNIEAKRINASGLHSYQLIGKLEGKRTKKLKPIGEPLRFGAMFQAINAYGALPNEINLERLKIASNEWALHLAGEIGDIEYQVG